MTSPDPTPTTDDPSRSARLLHEAGRIIAGWPRVHHRLRTAHRPDESGRCGACGTQTRQAPLWPCALAVLVRTGED